jgi:hypothetical protein
MYMSKKKFDEIKAKHSTTIVVDADVGEALAFVQDLLEAEADAIKKPRAARNCIYRTPE